jgi:hypothetical protein
MANFLVMLNTTSTFKAAPLLKSLSKEYGGQPGEAWTGDTAYGVFVAGAGSADALYEFVRAQAKGIKSAIVVELGRDCRLPDKGGGVAEWLAGHLPTRAAPQAGTRAAPTGTGHVYLYKGHQLHCQPEHTSAGRYSAQLIVVDPNGKTVLKRGFPTMEDFISEADAVEHARLCGEDMVNGTED